MLSGTEVQHNGTSKFRSLLCCQFVSNVWSMSKFQRIHIFAFAQKLIGIIAGQHFGRFLFGMLTPGMLPKRLCQPYLFRHLCYKFTNHHHHGVNMLGETTASYTRINMDVNPSSILNLPSPENLN